MKALIFLLLAYAATVSLPAVARIDEPDIDADCLKVTDYAALGKTAYQQREYAKAADIFRDQAAWSEVCGLSEQAIATAYNNVALSLIHASELLKARAYLELAPDDSKSQHNMKLLQQRLARQPVVTGPAGVYWQYAGRGVWSELEVKPKGKRWQIAYAGYYMPLMGLYYGPNIGEFTAELAIEQNKTVYHQHQDSLECDVQMHFMGDALEMKTAGDCGFGHNVRADGRFVRVE